MIQILLSCTASFNIPSDLHSGLFCAITTMLCSFISWKEHKGDACNFFTQLKETCKVHILVSLKNNVTAKLLLPI